jgi:hypothetical protein
MWWYRHGGTSFRRTRRDHLSRRAGDLFLPCVKKGSPPRRGRFFVPGGNLIPTGHPLSDPDFAPSPSRPGPRPRLPPSRIGSPITPSADLRRRTSDLRPIILRVIDSPTAFSHARALGPMRDWPPAGTACTTGPKQGMLQATKILPRVPSFEVRRVSAKSRTHNCA